jgi:hypothetical protein
MDILLNQTANGSDWVLKGTDIVIIHGFQNMPLFGLFGGNIESNTKEFKDGEQRFDWWGNNLFMPNDSSIQFNSDTERLINQVALTSSSRLLIEQAVKSDLAFMKSFAVVSSTVSIIAIDRLEITITIQQPGNVESNEFVYIWDSTRRELTGNNNY